MTALAQPTNKQRLPLWFVILIGGVITAISLGVRSTFGVLFDPITDDLELGRGSFAFAIAIQQLIWGVSQPVAGAISDRYGAARTLAAGCVLYVLAMGLMSQATSAVELVLSGGVLYGFAIGAASFAVVLSSVGRMVSPERRSVALGVVSALGSIGQFVLVPFAQWRLDATTWQNVVITLALISLATIVFTPALRGRASDFPQAAAAPGKPEAAKRTLREELRRAASSRHYLLLNAAFFVCGFHVTFIGTHLIAYAGDLGQEASTASRALAVIGLFNIFGSLAAGFLGVRYSNTRLLSGIYGARAVVITGFLLVPASATSTLIFGALIGLLWLSTVPLTSAIVSKQFGTDHAGSLFGIVFLSHQLGAFLGAWTGGAVSEATDSYVPVWWVAVGLGVFAAVIHLMIDEGPVPEPPPAAPGVRVRPATGFASVIVFGLAAAGVAAAFAPLGSAAQDAGEFVRVCFVALQ